MRPSYRPVIPHRAPYRPQVFAPLGLVAGRCAALAFLQSLLEPPSQTGKADGDCWPCGHRHGTRVSGAPLPRRGRARQGGSRRRGASELWGRAPLGAPPRG